MLQKHNTLQEDIVFSGFTGNIVPHHWYHTICNKSGKPDHIAISLLAEIVYWYRPRKNSTSNSDNFSQNRKFHGYAWQTSYANLERKFHYSRESIRRAFVKLEELGIIQRDLQSVQVRGQTYNNVLFIKLIDTSFLTASKTEINSKIIEIEDKKICTSNHKFDTPSPQICGDIYKEKETTLENNRSRSASFCKFDKILGEAELKADIHNLQNIERKKIKDFLPIDEDLYNKICLKTKRHFDICFVNRLTDKLSQKYSDHSYPNQSAFINYIAKALDNELMTEEFAKNSGSNHVEQYLSSIEYISDRTKEGQLKKKIAAVFSKETAYNLLSKCFYSDFSPDEDVYFLKVRDKVEEFCISAFEKEILLREVRSVFGDVKNIEFYREGEGVIDLVSGTTTIYKKETYNDTKMSALNNLNIYSEKIGKIEEKENIKNIEKTEQNNSNSYLESKIDIEESKKEITSETPSDIFWRQARRILRAKHGNAIDEAWFNKLKIEINEEENIIEIIAPSDFFKDWIKNNYIDDIKRALVHVTHIAYDVVIIRRLDKMI